MVGTLSASEEAQLQQTIEMFEVITQSQPQDYQSLEILKEAYQKLGRDLDVINTSKRIAQAYVMMGQLSSAILEYESVLQRCPDDAEVAAALSEIVTKANTLNAQASTTEALDATKQFTKPAKSKTSDAKAPSADMDDGNQAMSKIFVESKLIARGDFDLNGRVDADDYFLIDSNYNKPPVIVSASTAALAGAGAELPGGVIQTTDDDARERLDELN